MCKFLSPLQRACYSKDCRRQHENKWGPFVDSKKKRITHPKNMADTSLVDNCEKYSTKAKNNKNLLSAVAKFCRPRFQRELIEIVFSTSLTISLYPSTQRLLHFSIWSSDFSQEKNRTKKRRGTASVYCDSCSLLRLLQRPRVKSKRARAVLCLFFCWLHDNRSERLGPLIKDSQSTDRPLGSTAREAIFLILEPTPKKLLSDMENQTSVYLKT